MCYFKTEYFRNIMKSFRPYVVLLSVLLSHSGCEDIIDPNCNTMDPVNELEWITELTRQVDESCNSVQMSLFRATYKRHTVFYIQVTDPLAQVVFYVELYDCDGVSIKKFGQNEQDSFYDKVTDRDIIYSCVSEL